MRNIDEELEKGKGGGSGGFGGLVQKAKKSPTISIIGVAVLIAVIIALI